jgi:hypothetical protein
MAQTLARQGGWVLDGQTVQDCRDEPRLRAMGEIFGDPNIAE